jgi:hypothetical protein
MIETKKPEQKRAISINMTETKKTEDKRAVNIKIKLPHWVEKGY